MGIWVRVWILLGLNGELQSGIYVSTEYKYFMHTVTAGCMLVWADSKHKTVVASSTTGSYKD